MEQDNDLICAKCGEVLFISDEMKGGMQCNQCGAFNRVEVDGMIKTIITKGATNE